MATIREGAACAPWRYGEWIWIWGIGPWGIGDPSAARDNPGWRLHKIDPADGAIEWSSDIVELVDWPGPGGPVDFTRASQEPIRREEIDQQSHTCTPHLQSEEFALLGNLQGALICWDLSGTTPTEAWRKDGRIKDSGDVQEFLLPLGVDAEGRFLSAFRRAAWRWQTETHYYWPAFGWVPEDGGPQLTASIELPDGAPCGLVCFAPSDGTEVWRWEVPETGTWRQWERRTAGTYTSQVVDDEDILWGGGSVETPYYRAPGLALVDTPPLELGDEQYQRGSLIVSGPARYLDSGGSPVGSGSAIHLWSNVYPGMIDGYPYGDYLGHPAQYEPSHEVAFATEMWSEGDGPASWTVTWYQVYWGQQPVIAEGGVPLHSLTACAIPDLGVVLGPRTWEFGVTDPALASLTWRRVLPDPEHPGEAIIAWTRTIAPFGEGYAPLSSAPLVADGLVYTLVWELQTDGSEHRRPEMVVLDLESGDLVRRDAIPSGELNAVGAPQLIGLELVCNGSEIWARVAGKQFRYG